jgi:hypothetical protein
MHQSSPQTPRNNLPISCFDFAVIGLVLGLVGHGPFALQPALLRRAAYVLPDRAFALSFRSLKLVLVDT